MAVAFVHSKSSMASVLNHFLDGAAAKAKVTLGDQGAEL